MNENTDHMNNLLFKVPSERNNEVRMVTSKANNANNKTNNKLMYNCTEDKCGKIYSSLSGLNNHMRQKHSKNSIFSCDECPSMFSSLHDRTLHKIKEHEGRRYIKRNETKTIEMAQEYPCPECSKVFFTQEMFNDHRNHHDKNIPKFACADCGKEFITERKLKEHSIVHKERVMYKCNVCAKVFLRSQTLQYHRLICKAAYQCDQCVDSFMTVDALEKHKMFHLKVNFTCTKCNKVFPNQQALQNHERRHSIKMNYTCQICKETISTRAKFQKHLKDHLESNLSCPVCKEKFQNLAKYGYHKAEMHAIMRPYNCILCSDEFCTRHELFVHLHNHIDINTSTDTFACNHCNSKFSLKEHYEQHKKTHATDPQIKNIDNNDLDGKDDDEDDDDIDNELEPIDSSSQSSSLHFKCIDCNDRSFEHQSILQHHRLTEHDLKKFPCTIGFCDQIFSSLDQLKFHVIQHHNENQLNDNNSLLNLNECRIDGCKRTFQYPSRLERHMSTHVLDEYKCPRCTTTYYSEAVFNAHVVVCVKGDQNVNLDRTGPVLCKLCFQLFENEAVLDNHRRFCTDDRSSIFSEDDSEISSVFDSQLNSPLSSPGNFSIKSPESILSVYVQNDCDSNFLPEL